MREIARSSFGQLRISRYRGWIELKSIAHIARRTAHREVHVFANLQNRALIAATIAVVRRGEHCDDILVVTPVETLTVNTQFKNALPSPLDGRV